MRRILATLVMLTDNEACSFRHLFNGPLFKKEWLKSKGENHNA